MFEKVKIGSKFHIVDTVTRESRDEFFSELVCDEYVKRMNEWETPKSVYCESCGLTKADSEALHTLGDRSITDVYREGVESGRKEAEDRLATALKRVRETLLSPEDSHVAIRANKALNIIDEAIGYDRSISSKEDETARLVKTLTTPPSTDVVSFYEQLSNRG